jgi:hypothetical protein
MKKLTLSLGFMLLSGTGYCDVGDLIKTTLTEHVATVTQFKSRETRLALVDSVILIGRTNGKSILDVQAGFSGTTVDGAVSGEPNSADLILGGQFKISSILSNSIKFSPEFVFLNSLEYGPSYFYDTRTHSGYLSFQVGLAFNLNPIR